jgi:hypothetical protein
MKMNMKNSLACSWAVINYQSITVAINFFVFCYCFCDIKQVSYQFPVLYRAVLYVRDMHLGNDQNMDRGLGVEVFECNSEFVLMNDFGRNFFFDYLTEDTMRVQIQAAPYLLSKKCLKKQLRCPV